MKTTICRILFAWALALIAMIGKAESNFVIEPWPDNGLQRAYLKGDKNKYLSRWTFTNTGNTPGRITGFSFNTTGVSLIIFQVDNLKGERPVLNDRVEMPLPRVIDMPVGASFFFTVFADISPNATAVSSGVPVPMGTYDRTNVNSSMRATTHYAVDVLERPNLVNMSARTTLAAGEVFTTGFVLGGDPQHTYPVLIRAVGHSLINFGIMDNVYDPSIELFDSKNVSIQKNDDWPQELVADFREAGAFSLIPFNKDAAILALLKPGPYTVVVKANGIGEVLVEQYSLPERR